MDAMILPLGEICTAPPPVPQVPEATRNALIREILERELRFSDSVIAPGQDTLVKWVGHLMRSGPRSRTEIERWARGLITGIDTLRLDASVDAHVAITEVLDRVVVDRVSGPEFLPSSELHARCEAALGHLESMNTLCSTRLGRPLYWDHQAFLNPFESRDPWHWFVALVTRLYVLLVDHPARSGLAVISRSFRYDSKRNDIVGEPLSSLPELVDCLRTVLQHGLKVTASDNAARMKTAQAWYVSQCAQSAPSRGHGRLLAQALLREFESLVAEVKLVLDAPYSDETERIILGTLARASRDVAQIEIAWALSEAARLLQAPVDVERVLRKHQARIRKEMENCCLGGKELQDFLRSRCEVIVAEEMQICPIDGSWLKARGVEEGQALGNLLRQFNRDWNAAPGMSKTEFIAAVERHLEASGYKPPEESAGGEKEQA
jgi:hypothetical protein